MKQKITKSDFTFTLAGTGMYNVTFKSPKTGKIWSAKITDMQLIDDVNYNPKASHLNKLKMVVKYFSKFN